MSKSDTSKENTAILGQAEQFQSRTLVPGLPDDNYSSSPVKKFYREGWFAHLTVFLSLIICEMLWFSPIISKVGFYLDDWAVFSELSNAQQTWNSLLQVCLRDPRIIVRPVETVYYVASWLAFHDQPWGHHFLHCCLEVLASFLIYLVLCRLSGNRAFSFTASVLVLVYPSHDATHYWVTSSITLSLVLYLFSLWQAIKAVQDQKPICFLFSTLAFFASLLTYEAFLPLIFVTAICLVSLYRQKYNWRESWLKLAAVLSPSSIAILATYYYQRVLLMQSGKGFHHSMSLSLPHAVEVIREGLCQNLYTSGFSIFIFRAQEAFADLSVRRICSLSALVAIIALTTFFVNENDSKPFRPYAYIGLGIAWMILSYVLFAASPEYNPQLESIMNRINLGASVGSSIFIAALITGLSSHVWNKHREHQSAACALMTILAAPIITFFVLADWGWSIPWMTSWGFQKYVVQLVKKQAKTFSDGDSIILAHTPRYVMWSPLFDGVWDFESMLRLYVKPGIKGGVVSDRMSLSKDAVKDISMGYLCGSYPFTHLFVLVPSPERWIKTRSAPEFIAAIKQYGMGFGLAESTINRWRKEIACSQDAPSNPGLNGKL